TVGYVLPRHQRVGEGIFDLVGLGKNVDLIETDHVVDGLGGSGANQAVLDVGLDHVLEATSPQGPVQDFFKGGRPEVEAHLAQDAMDGFVVAFQAGAIVRVADTEGGAEVEAPKARRAQQYFRMKIKAVGD